MEHNGNMKWELIRTGIREICIEKYISQHLSCDLVVKMLEY